MARRARRGRRFVRYIVGAVGVGAALAALAWSGHALPSSLAQMPLFSVGRVEVVGAGLPEVGELVAAAGLAAQERVGQLDLQAAAERLLALPPVRKADLTWLPPDRVRIRITKREPVALLSLDQTYGVDRDLWCFTIPSDALPTGLPMVTGVSPSGVAPSGRLTNPAVGEAIRVVDALGATDPALASQVAEVAMTPEGIDLVLRNGRVRLGRGRYEDKLRVVLMVLDDLASRSETYAEIDVRFRELAVVRGPRGA